MKQILAFFLLLGLSALPSLAQDSPGDNSKTAGILASPRPRLDALLDALAAIDVNVAPERPASPFEPPGRPGDRPPGSPPGQGDPPDPPGRPSDRPSGELPPGQTR